MIALFLQTLYTEIKAAIRNRGQIIMAPAFFILMTTLFPLAIGPSTQGISIIAPALVCVAVLFSVFLSLDRFFTQDYESGLLDYMLTSTEYITAYVAGKILSCWITTAFVLALISPLIGAMLGIPFSEAIPLVLVTAGLGWILILFGALGAALSLTSRYGVVLLAMIAFPLFIPALVFAAGGLLGHIEDHNRSAQAFLYLGALISLSTPIIPLFIGKILKWQIR